MRGWLQRETPKQTTYRRCSEVVQMLRQRSSGAILSVGEAWCLFHGFTLSGRHGGVLMERLLALLAETGEQWFTDVSRIDTGSMD
ncbi:MAG: hypothetical protein QXN23_01690 [Candidatus Caldarchaeum sp.]